MRTGPGREEPAREGVGAPIFQVHPSLRCNLACAHCYSASTPLERDRLDPADIILAVEDAVGLGFGILSVSGGEPLLWPHLKDLLVHARHLGMRTQIVTNGWLLAGPRYEAVADLIDLVAVSVDGPKGRHNAMRGSPRAFAATERGLAALRRAGSPFGIIHTVSAANWQELADVAAFAAASGARLFQIHMLESAGRAGVQDIPDEDVALRTFILAALLKVSHAGTMEVHIDLQHRDVRPGLCDGRHPAAAIDILILEADGAILPLSYGFDRRFLVADIRKERLNDAWPGFVQGPYRQFLKLRRQTDQFLSTPAAPEVFNWFELMAARSQLLPPDPAEASVIPQQMVPAA